LHAGHIEWGVNLPDVEQVFGDVGGDPWLATPCLGHTLDEVWVMSAGDAVAVVFSDADRSGVDIPRHAASPYLSQAVASIEPDFLEQGLEGGLVLEDLFDKVAGGDVLLGVDTAVGACTEGQSTGSQAPSGVFQSLAQGSGGSRQICLWGETVESCTVVSKLDDELYALFLAQVVSRVRSSVSSRRDAIGCVEDVLGPGGRAAFALGPVV